MTQVTNEDPLLATVQDLPGIDCSGWKKVGGTQAGGYYEVARGVLVAVPVPGYVQRAPDARRSLEEFHRLVARAGRPLAAIILVDHVKSQDAAARRVWAQDDDATKRCGLALVCASPLSRAIGSFFIGFNRPTVPTKMIRSFSEALAWCQERVEQAWADDGGEP